MASDYIAQAASEFQRLNEPTVLLSVAIAYGEPAISARVKRPLCGPSLEGVKTSV